MTAQVNCRLPTADKLDAFWTPRYAVRAVMRLGRRRSLLRVWGHPRRPGGAGDDLHTKIRAYKIERKYPGQ